MNLQAAGTGLWLDNARVPAALAEGFALRDADVGTGLATVDLGISGDGSFGAPAPTARRIDLQGRLVLPAFVDSHVHLDKAYTVARTGLPDGGLLAAVRLAGADAANWTAADLESRMERALARAHANGTAALRTHLDTPVPPMQSASWQVLGRLRQVWRGRLDIQAVALMALERVDDAADYAERCRQIAALEGVLGAFIAPGMATAARLDRLFDMAARYGLAVDFHVDETLDPASRGLEMICDSLARTGFDGPVMAGHCCSLATMPQADRARIIAKVAACGVHVVSLPHSNLFLQDRRAGTTPRQRGLTAVQELRAAGASVHFASDNVQDPFYPYGDFDVVEVFRTGVQAVQLEADLGAWLIAQCTEATRACGFAGRGRLTPGGPADAVIFEARGLPDLMSQRAGPRLVIRQGVPVRPDHADLSTLLTEEVR